MGLIDHLRRLGLGARAARSDAGCNDEVTHQDFGVAAAVAAVRRFVQDTDVDEIRRYLTRTGNALLDAVIAERLDHPETSFVPLAALPTGPAIVEAAPALRGEILTLAAQRLPVARYVDPNRGCFPPDRRQYLVAILNIVVGTLEDKPILFSEEQAETVLRIIALRVEDSNLYVGFHPDDIPVLDSILANEGRPLSRERLAALNRFRLSIELSRWHSTWMFKALKRLHAALGLPESASQILSAEAARQARRQDQVDRLTGSGSALLDAYTRAVLASFVAGHPLPTATAEQIANARAAVLDAAPQSRGRTLAGLLRIHPILKERQHEALSFDGIGQKLHDLFRKLLGRKIEISDEGLACVMASVPDIHWGRDLRVIKLVEEKLAAESAPLTRTAARQALYWLRGIPRTYPRQYRDAALRRLEDALALGRTDTGELEPPTITETHPFFLMPRLRDEYGDLADLRKSTARHVACVEGVAEAVQLTGKPDDAAPVQMLAARLKGVAALPDELKAIWVDLSVLGRELEGKTKPAAKWIKSARSALTTLGEEQRVNLLERILSIVEPDARLPLTSDNVARGLIYLAVDWPADSVAPILARYAHRVCFKTVKSVGIKGARLGNACLWTLINLPDGAGVPYLSRLLTRIKYPSVKKKIGAALDEAAAKAGITRAELDELSVPTHDLGPDGTVEIAIGDGVAVISVNGGRSAEITWRPASGRVSQSVPAAFKADKAGIKAARRAASEIEADLAAQVYRLQRLYLENRRWTVDAWRERYAEHPLVAPLASALIWNVHRGEGRTAALWRDGKLRGVTDEPVDANDAVITLWHPLSCPVKEVRAWREHLAELGVIQPFKQAHREVYLVTEAERRTGVYSNRFAGHILKQHQMMTLARLSGWNVTHRIWADVPNDEPTHLVVPAYGLMAEFWTEGAGGDDPEVTESQAYLYLSTDQVRFHHLAQRYVPATMTARGPARDVAIEMADVPPVVFSEVMRMCDLFVGVASIAADPNWRDAGAAAQHPNQWRQHVAHAYWQREAFGELGVMAQARQALLEELIPKLSIADQCQVVGRFLHVQGKRRSYRIHIGSANILMEPNDQYLCIVPTSRRPLDGRDDIVLPFEGDQVLSIILSKAFMLAADDTIKDESILRQLQPQ